MAEFRVAERFVSINGEAARAGELAVFIRFVGCNLACTYCDTAWANASEAPYELETEVSLCEYVRASGVKNVTLTGGEPLLQEELPVLLRALYGIGVLVEIETNGSVSIAEIAAMPERPVFTLDYKLPGSGMENRMLTENYRYLMEDDTVKFVAGSREDLLRAAQIIREHDLTARCHVYLSPVFGRIEPKDMVTFMQEECLNGVRLQLQLHKFIWDPSERGV